MHKLYDISQGLKCKVSRATQTAKDCIDSAKQKPLKFIAMDSAIIAGIAAAAILPNTVPTFEEVWIIIKVFVGAFLVEVAVERGLKRKQ